MNVSSWKVVKVLLAQSRRKASDQKSTLAGNSRMFARLLFSVLRTIEQGHKWSEEYPFDRKQKAAAQTLKETIDAKEIVDDTVKEAIHDPRMALFCKMHPRWTPLIPYE